MIRRFILWFSFLLSIPGKTNISPLLAVLEKWAILTIDLHHYHYVFCQQFRIMCNQLLPKNVCYKNTLLFFYIWSKGMRFDTADQHSVLVPLTTTHLCSPFNDCFFLHIVRPTFLTLDCSFFFGNQFLLNHRVIGCFIWWCSNLFIHKRWCRIWEPSI